MQLKLVHLRRQAIANSLFTPRTLRQAIGKLGFVQADPIRSPARAQDLILRHRVKDYRAGDLEQEYRRLKLEEDFLYAYGFMPQGTWQILHPRHKSKLTAAEQRVLEHVSSHKQIHPRELERDLGREREVNAWGGYSKATTRVLHHLHYRGLLRIAGRENGIRLYEATRKQREPMPAKERSRLLTLLVARILAPLPDRSLLAAMRHVAHYAPGFNAQRLPIASLIRSGELAAATVDGLRYVWPYRKRVERPSAPDVVRFLAPFDPLVWDRIRFEHLWGWRYRFEAYTPLAKRKLGYYAMPMLWRDDVIGWVTIFSRQGKLSVHPGFTNAMPSEAAFRDGFEAEVERFRRFLEGRDTA